MLNEQKIRLMTKLALYEKKAGREDIKLSTYYKTDYVRMQILKTIISVTIGYLLILLLVLIYKSEYLIAEAVNLDYVKIGKALLIIYLCMLVVFCFFAAIGYSIKYKMSRKNLAGYYQMLKELKMIYHEEDELTASFDAHITDGEDTII